MEAHLFLCRRGNHSSCCHRLSTLRLESWRSLTPPCTRVLRYTLTVPPVTSHTELIGSLDLFTSYHHWLCLTSVNLLLWTMKFKVVLSLCVCVCDRVRPRWPTEVWRTTTRCSSRLSPSLRPPGAHPSPSPSSPPLRSCTSPQSDPPLTPPCHPVSASLWSDSCRWAHVFTCYRWDKTRQVIVLLDYLSGSLRTCRLLKKSDWCQRTEKCSFCHVLSEGAGWQGQWGAAVPNTNLIQGGTGGRRWRRTLQVTRSITGGIWLSLFSSLYFCPVAVGRLRLSCYSAAAGLIPSTLNPEHVTVCLSDCRVETL